MNCIISILFRLCMCNSTAYSQTKYKYCTQCCHSCSTASLQSICTFGHAWVRHLKWHAPYIATCYRSDRALALFKVKLLNSDVLYNIARSTHMISVWLGTCSDIQPPICAQAGAFPPQHTHTKLNPWCNNFFVVSHDTGNHDQLWVYSVQGV